MGNLDFHGSVTPVPVVHYLWPKLSISSGGYHTCAVVDLLGERYSGAQCWGDNYFGQLGNNTFESTASPVEVINLPNDIISVTAGFRFSCALSESGRVKCWGDNHAGKLGIGIIASNKYPIPQDVVDEFDPSGLLNNVIVLDSGSETTCALIEDGNVLCWGKNSCGGLGDQTTEDSGIPVSVIDFNDPSELLTGVTDVSAGPHSCAVTDEGKVKCWGCNGYGQLGDGTLDSRGYPEDVVGLPDGVSAVAVTTGQMHTCVLMEDGEVWCWGINTFVPGGGTAEPYPEPVHVNIADSTPPVIEFSIDGTLGDNGWYIDDVMIVWEVNDEESELLLVEGCGEQLVNYDTLGINFTCSATSTGGTTNESITIKRDSTAPTVIGSAAPPPNIFGWNNTSVTVSFTGTDETSGIDHCTPSVLLIREDIGLWATGSCSDNAGNASERVTVSSINIDKTAPEVTVTGVEDLAVYILGDVPVAGCHTEDNLSGLVVEASLTLTGGNPDGTGTFKATCADALDLAGNTSADVSVTYKVITPQGATTIAIDSVNNLQALNVLNDGLTTSLVTKLELARKAMDTLRNPRTALNLLQAFINQVKSLVEEGILTQEQGQALIDEVESIIAAIS